MAQNINQITAPRVDFLDQNGKIAREWYMYLYNLYTVTGAGTGVTPIINGGTGLSTLPTNGQLLIGNAGEYKLNTLGADVGISVTNGPGTIVLANTGVLSNIAGSGISVSSATGNVTIANTGVLSFSAGTTGLTPVSAAVGAVVLGGTLKIANGGTNGTAVPTAGAVPYGTGTAYAFNAVGTSGQVLTSAGAGTPTWTTPTTGTVTSVGLSLPAEFTVSNSPVTSSGTLTAVWASETAKYFFAAPNAANGTPLFRAIVASDIPALAYAPQTSGTSILYGNGTGGFSNVTIGSGISFAAGTLSATGSGGTVTSVTGTAPVVSSGGTTPAISLAAAYGDTLNPYAAKTANYVLAGPTTGAAAVPAFRALVAADIPSLSYVTSVSGTSGRITSTGGTTPIIDLASGVATAGTTGSSLLIPVVTIDTYGRVTTITTASNPQGTVTSVAALTLGTTGTDLSSSVATGTTTPVITLNVPTASATNRGALSSTDWTTFNSKGSGTVTSVTFTGGIISVATGTTTPAFTVAGTSGGIPYFASGTTWASSAALIQYGVVYGGGAGAAPVATAAGTTGQVLTATTGGAPTWAAPATSGTVTSVSVVSANGFAGTVATSTTTPAITLTTTITGLLKGNGTAISAAVANTDYVPLSTVLTKTADYTITNTDMWIINNKTGSALTLTFPAASSWTGRSITVKNMQAQLVNSASSNIVPIDSTTAGTAILLNVIGNWATMVSDGTNWVIMQAASNNNLLLE